jgi:hypothetical protein
MSLQAGDSAATAAMVLLTAFSLQAILLAVAFAGDLGVAQRTRDGLDGIGSAATRRSRLVLRRNMLLVLGGLVLGQVGDCPPGPFEFVNPDRYPGHHFCLA